MKITGTNKTVTLLKLNFIEENECGGNVLMGTVQRKYRAFFFSDTPYCVNIIRT